jgi:asparagine synthase (glutamine-hydrolysing)
VNLTAGAPVELDTLRRMIGALRHRGPDETGLYRDAWAGLASARLSIVDLAGGQQPIGNEDGSLWVVFNGEIFNYLELRPALERRGHQFATQCDTEILLHLYEEHGPDFLNCLNGQYVLALWDSRRRRLMLARDRLGIRPLFYSEQAGRLVFGSEVKAILAGPAAAAEIDRGALRQVFTYWSVQSPRSIFSGIQEVPPGHYLLAEDGQVTVHEYWSLDFTEDARPRPEAEYLDELEHLLTDATRARLWADVPVGAYLSGGLDSSLTAALIRRQDSSPLDTFSIAFSDPGFDESAHQRQMAQFLGTDHQEVFCTQADIGRAFPDVIWHTETPILRTAPAPMFLLSKLVHERGYKVVLTGEGADEMLAGYDLFKEAQVRRFWARRPESQIRPRLLARLYPDIPRLAQSSAFLTAFFRRGLEQTAAPFYAHHIRWSNTARTWRFLAEGDDCPPPGLQAEDHPIALPAGFAGWSPLAQAQYVEMRSFLSPYLLSSQGDRVAMAHSVEGRYPFLDYRVAEFCARLPARLKLRGLSEKWLLRQLGRKYLPAEIWQRTKRPYRAPIQRSFFAAGEGLDYVDDLLSETALKRSGHFKAPAVAGLAAKARGGAALSEVEEMALVGILSTQLVDRWFVQGARQATPPAPLETFKVVDRAAAPAG